MLDITDNIVEDKIVAPARVVRHDGDDAYLVVAADKGTATFSDIANAISEEYGFWLGDAFASGGSAGYDHKKMAHHRARRLGMRQAPFPRNRRGHPEPGFLRRRHRRHGRRRVRQRHAAIAAHPPDRRLQSPAHLHRPAARTRRARSRSASGCSRCRAPRGRTTRERRSPRAAACTRAAPRA